jgi:hypothetical protein
MALTKAGLLALSRTAFVTRSTSSSWPNSRASSLAAVGTDQHAPDICGSMPLSFAVLTGDAMMAQISAPLSLPGAK